MSTKEYVWSEMTRKNPRLLDNPHFTTASARKFFDAVYEAGWNAGYKLAAPEPRPEAADLFTTFFGGKP
jgi:hypothetical protein